MVVVFVNEMMKDYKKLFLNMRTSSKQLRSKLLGRTFRLVPTFWQQVSSTKRTCKFQFLAWVGY